MNKKVLRNKGYLMAHTFNRIKMFHTHKGWLLSSALFLALAGTTVGASANSISPTATTNKQPTTTEVQGQANNVFQNLKQEQGTNRIVYNAPNSSSNIAKATKVSSSTSNTNSASSSASSTNKVASSASTSNKNVSKDSMANDLVSANSTTSSSASKSISSASTKPSFNSAYMSYKARYGSEDANIANINKENVIGIKNVKLPKNELKNNVQGQTVMSDNHWIYIDNQYYTSDEINGWKESPTTYRGLFYKYNSQAHAVEIGGNNSKYNTWNMDNFIKDAPATIKAANSIKINSFDYSSANQMPINMLSSDINVKSIYINNSFSDATDLDSMFKSDVNLLSIDFGNLNDKSSSFFGQIFTNDSKLRTIIINSSKDASNVFSVGGYCLPTQTWYPVLNKTTGYTSNIATPSLSAYAGTFSRYKKLMPTSDTDIIKFNDIYNNNDKYNIPKSKIEKGIPNVKYTVSTPQNWAFVDKNGNIISNPTFKYIDGNQTLTIAPIYKGLVYKYSKANNSIEFVSGTPNNDLSNFISNAPTAIKNASTITFDNINTNNVTNMSNMFNNDNNLKTLVINSKNTKFNNNSGLKMYKELSQTDKNNKPYTSANLTDFTKGVTGTFVSQPNIQDTKTTLNFMDGHILVKSISNNQLVNTPITVSTINNDIKNISDSNNQTNSYIPRQIINNLIANGSTYQIQVAHKSAPYSVEYVNQNNNIIGSATITSSDLANQGAYEGKTINIEPEVEKDVPEGYHLPNSDKIMATLNDGGIINANATNTKPKIMLGSMLGNSSVTDNTQNTNDNHVIHVDGNSVRFNINIILKFNINGQEVKSDTKAYSITSNVGSDVTLNKPSHYLDNSTQDINKNDSIILSSNNFEPSNNDNNESFTVSPSDAPIANKVPTITKTYSLTFNAKKMSDSITYDLSGKNIPNNYRGKTGIMNPNNQATTISGTYDTPINLNNVPNNYHIVSGSNIKYNGHNHTVEIAPNNENVNVIYTDQNGKQYKHSINGKYKQQIKDVTQNQNAQLPTGYHLSNNQNSSYEFNNDKNQSKALKIEGNQESGTVKININKYDNGKFISDNTQNVSEAGQVGNEFIINPNDSSYLPQGYRAQNGIYTGYFTPAGLSNNLVTFNYDANKGSAITVNYINQSNKNVGKGTIVGNVDDTGNITTKVPTPTGYTINVNQPSTYHITTTPQETTIHVTGKDANQLNGNGKFTITIDKKVNNQLNTRSTRTITIKGRVGDNFTITPSNYTPNGYTSISNPIQSSITPNGLAQNSATFIYTANQAKPITVSYINQNNKQIGNGQIKGKVDQTGITTKVVTVPNNYNLNNGQNIQYKLTTQAQTINLKVTGKPASATIKFINQNNQQISTSDINGKVDDTINITKYPTGYVKPSTLPTYTFTKPNQNSDKTIQLTGQVASNVNKSKQNNYKPSNNLNNNIKKGYVTIHVIEKSTNGIILHKFNSYISENNKRVGDNYTVNPSDTQPSDYNIDSNDKALNGTINNDGSLTNGQVTFNYIVNPQSIMPITITYKNQYNHYINITTGYTTKSAQEATTTIGTDTLAKLGGIGDKVNIIPYINAPRGYHFTSNSANLEDSQGQHLNALPLLKATPQHHTLTMLLGIWIPESHNNSGNTNNNKNKEQPSNNNNKPVNPIEPSHKNPNANKNKGNNNNPIKPSNASQNSAHHQSKTNQPNTNKGKNKKSTTPNQTKHNTNNSHKEVLKPTNNPKQTNKEHNNTNNKKNVQPSPKKPSASHKKLNLNKHINHQINVMHHTINKLRHEYHLNNVTKHNNVTNNTHNNKPILTHKQRVDKTITFTHPIKIATSNSKVTHINRGKLPKTNEINNKVSVMSTILIIMASFFIAINKYFDRNKRHEK